MWDLFALQLISKSIIFIARTPILQIQGGEIISDGASLLAITVVEFMAKQATGKKY